MGSDDGRTQHRLSLRQNSEPQTNDVVNPEPAKDSAKTECLMQVLAFAFNMKILEAC